MTRAEMIAQMTILIDRAMEAGWEACLDNYNIDVEEV